MSYSIPEGLEYWYTAEDGKSAIRDDAPEWAKKEFEDFLKATDDTPDEDGKIHIV